MQIRAYRDGDFSMVAILLRETGLFYRRSDKKELYHRKIEQDPNSILLAEQPPDLVGIVISNFDPLQPSITRLATSPRYQSKEIRDMLLKEAEKRLKEKGAETVTLFIGEENQDFLKYCKDAGYIAVDKSVALMKRF